MPKIFRNIRKKLLAADKVTDYLKYALGEILLVVIGILIALQVNNWKEDIQSRDLEITTLENMRTELNLQIEIINEQLQFERIKSEKADSAELYLSSPFSLNKLNTLLMSLSERRTFTENKTSYIGMDKTVDKKLIRNPTLQNAIIRYYQQLDYVTQVVNNNNLFLVDSHFGSFSANNSLNIRLKEDGSFEKGLKLSPEKRLALRNQLGNRKSVSENNYRLCKAQLLATKKLIQMIDKKIDR